MDGELRLRDAQGELLRLGGEEDPGHRQVVAVLGQDDEQVEQQLLAVLVHEGARVVQPQEQHVQHEGHVHGPVHLHAVHHDVREQHHRQVAPVEAAAWLGAVREELGERREVAAVLGHGQRVRLRDVVLVHVPRERVRVLGLLGLLGLLDGRWDSFVGQGRRPGGRPAFLGPRPQRRVGLGGPGAARLGGVLAAVPLGVDGALLVRGRRLGGLLGRVRGRLAHGREPEEGRRLGALDEPRERLHRLQLGGHLVHEAVGPRPRQVQRHALGKRQQLVGRHARYDEQVADDDLEVVRPAGAQRGPHLLHLLGV